MQYQKPKSVNQSDHIHLTPVQKSKMAVIWVVLLVIMNFVVMFLVLIPGLVAGVLGHICIAFGHLFGWNSGQ